MNGRLKLFLFIVSISGILLFSAFSAASTVYGQGSQSYPPYITEIVSQEVITVNGDGNQNLLLKGIQEVARKYNIKGGIPLIAVGSHNNAYHSTVITAVILFVEPKKNQVK